MTNEEAGKLRERAYRTALRKGFDYDFAEDVAQETVFLYLRKKIKPGALDRLVIDAVRKILGDSRTKKRIAARAVKFVPLEVIYNDPPDEWD